MQYDFLVIGGGINGAGIARDAAGRGLKTLLVEQGDLAGATSSASTKLIHGGLRYLEYGEFRLVRKALQERAVLQRIAPHIVTPLRFIMPTPARGRPRWLIRLGLFLYDHLADRGGLPGSSGVSLAGKWGDGLKDRARGGFIYSDCWVDDARLVVLNALSAHEKGADIRVRTRFVAAEPVDGGWHATLLDVASGTTRTVRARAIINAAGPWVDSIVNQMPAVTPDRPVRLVKGSHVVVRRRFDGPHAYIFQNDDGRIMFAIPYERDFTLVGTTDIAQDGDPANPQISSEEIDYLCREANRFLADEIAPKDIVYSFSGVRPLYDDGADNASAVTRDYVLRLGADGLPPVMSIYGGKITTYRKLAEHVLEQMAPVMGFAARGWSDSEPLPGGDIAGIEQQDKALQATYPFLMPDMANRLARSYGSRAVDILGQARSLEDLGLDFGGGLTQREVDYLVEREWARTCDDVLWRRTKLGLHLSPAQVDRLAGYMTRVAG